MENCHYGNHEALDGQVAHSLGQPLIIFAQILALQNLANVSRSNYVYLVFFPPVPSLPFSLPLPLSHSLYNHRADRLESPLFVRFLLEDAYHTEEENREYSKCRIIRCSFYTNHIHPFTHYSFILSEWHSKLPYGPLHSLHIGLCGSWTLMWGDEKEIMFCWLQLNVNTIANLWGSRVTLAQISCLKERLTATATGNCNAP